MTRCNWRARSNRPGPPSQRQDAGISWVEKARRALGRAVQNARPIRIRTYRLRPGDERPRPRLNSYLPLCPQVGKTDSDHHATSTRPRRTSDAPAALNCWPCARAASSSPAATKPGAERCWGRFMLRRSSSTRAISIPGIDDSKKLTARERESLAVRNPRESSGVAGGGRHRRGSGCAECLRSFAARHAAGAQGSQPRARFHPHGRHAAARRRTGIFAFPTAPSFMATRARFPLPPRRFWPRWRVTST